jgi:hypothetical protein
MLERLYSNLIIGYFRNICKDVKQYFEHSIGEFQVNAQNFHKTLILLRTKYNMHVCIYKEE